MNILLVEDELFIRMDLQQRLQALGAHVVASTAKGLDAVQLAKEYAPEMILMDIKLKGEMNGIEAANKISQFLKCNIIFISAYENEDLGLSLTDSDCKIGYFSKPLGDETLKAILKEYSSF